MVGIGFEAYFIVQVAFGNDAKKLSALATDISSNFGFSRDEVDREIGWKIRIIASIESYLMAHWDDTEAGLQEGDIVDLAKGTLAYYLSDNEQKLQIIELFKILADNISKNIPEPAKRKMFGKTLYGVHDSIDIEKWVLQNIEKLIACRDEDALCITLWPILYERIPNKTFKKCDPEVALRNLTIRWIQGDSFHKLFELLSTNGAKIIAGTQQRHIKFEHIIEICESALAYDGMLIICAITEIVCSIRHQEVNLIEKLLEFQKRLKYGLPSSLDIVLYEIGFSDRIIAMDISSVFHVSNPYRRIVVQRIKQNEKQIRELLSNYPSYFSHVLDGVINEITQL